MVIGYPNVTRGPGFLGAKHGYVYLTDTEAGPSGLTRPEFISAERADRREGLLAQLRKDYTAQHKDDKALVDYDTAIEESFKLVRLQTHHLNVAGYLYLFIDDLMPF